ncbi:MAG: antitoxin family protein [Acidobacteriota bacterium]
MTEVIEAVYENGVLKPLVVTRLKERQHYKLIVQEEPKTPLFEESGVDPDFLAELERRTTILPDGRKIVRLENILARYIPPGEEGERLVAEALADVRREQKALFEAKLDKYYPLNGVEEEIPADK